MKIVKASFGNLVRVSPYDDENITLSIDDMLRGSKRATLNVDMAHDLMYALADAVGWPPEPELPVFAEGDRVQVLKDPTFNSGTAYPHHTGAIGTVTEGPDEKDDYVVLLDGMPDRPGATRRFFAGSLCPAPEVTFEFGDKVLVDGEEGIFLKYLQPVHNLVRVVYPNGETGLHSPYAVTKLDAR